MKIEWAVVAFREGNPTTIIASHGPFHDLNKAKEWAIKNISTQARHVVVRSWLPDDVGIEGAV